MNVAEVLFGWLDIIFNYMFFFTRGLMRAFSISLFFLTLGCILGASRKKFINTYIKYTLYFYYVVYILYTYGLFYNIAGANFLEISVLITGVLMPISMIFLGSKLKSIKLRGKKIFSSTILWTIYVLLALVWEMLFPTDISFGFCLFYAMMSFFAFYIFKKRQKMKGGMQNV